MYTHIYISTYMYLYAHQKYVHKCYIYTYIYIIYAHISKASMFERQKHVEPHTARPSLRISIAQHGWIHQPW